MSDQSALPENTPENTIAFQGFPGAYSHLACRNAMPDMTPLPCRTFQDAFDAVSGGKARLAMIPIDNSVAGRVADIHHLMPDSGLHIIGEHYERINHHLLAVQGAELGDITHVHSHVHALGQCMVLIKELNIHPVVHVDTAGAAADIARNADKTQAAIASSLAGETYGLNSMRANIEDADHNTTRFVVMSCKGDAPSADLKPHEVITSFVFRVRNVPAALYKAMGGFATNGINMTKLESYVDGEFVAAQFYADVEGHPDHMPMQHAFEELRFFTHEVHIMGTYPAHEYRKSLNANGNGKA